MSTKSLAGKLLIKKGQRVLLLQAPDEIAGLLVDRPEEVEIYTQSDNPADSVLYFVRSQTELEANLINMKNSLNRGGILWVCYPKGSTKSGYDINRDTIWKYGKTIGLEGVAMVSIDETWSAMRMKIND